ncbi:S8 family peptidase [Dyella telluris]|uniref:S8 family serine peptidase n=1 Tax=Dyella telluris TaxID=2763498 RepID=A0A7G8Q3B1_9GAMM|nr:S8 family peptidase [Dyella telluris]QNK01269.1 S8 family serine peptidase [Dyella telluris]
MFKFRPFQTCALAAALALALPVAHAADTVSADVAGKISLAALQAHPQVTYDRFIVTYRNGTTENLNASAATQNVGQAAARLGNGNVSVGHVRKLATGAHLMHTSRRLSASEATQFMAQIAADPAVAHVEPDVMMQLVRDIPSTQKLSAQAAAAKNVTAQDLLSGAPNDSYYANYQWHFQPVSSSDLGSADVEKAWTVADGAGVTVAVLDTGITQHPDLDESLADAGYDFTSTALVSGRAADGRAAGGWDLGDWTTGDAYAGCRDAGDSGENSSWHGTHVSGTIAELTNNGTGMAGIAHAARVLPVRVLGHCGGYTSDIADAITWASGGHVDGVPDNQNVAQVISMSLGGSGICSASDAFGVAIAGAISRGTTVVVAAGNSGSNVSGFSPASCPGVISVASNGITGKRAFYSNYGTGVTISAPGGGIYVNDASSGTQANPTGFVWSTVNSGTTVPASPTYGGMAGTSQATPHVSGVIALMLGAEKDAGLTASTPAQIATILTSTARAFPVVEDYPIGAGIVDAYAAVQKAVSGSDNGGGGGDGDSAITLTANTVLAGQSGGAGTATVYSITVPAGASNLSLRSFGGTGDVSMYVKAGSAPAADGSNADFSSRRPGNTETVVIAKPAATTYYISIAGGATSFSGLSVLASYTK